MRRILSAGIQLQTHHIHPHSHEFWELVYCTEGEGCFESVNGGTVEYKKGDVVIIPPKVGHSNRSEHGFSNIHLIIDTFERVGNNIIKVADNASGILYSGFAQCNYFFNSKLSNRREVLSYLAEIIISCISTFMDTDFFSPIIEKIRADIINNFTDYDFNVNSALELKGNSAEYLRKTFKKETGITPLQFLTETRINYAKKLLKSKLTCGSNVSEIALECGFKDSLYFSRLFKKYVGCPPNAYAKDE